MKLLTITVFALFAFVGIAGAQTTTNCTGSGDSVSCTSTPTPEHGLIPIGSMVAGHKAKAAEEKQAEVNLVFCQQNPGGQLTDMDCKTEIATVKAKCVVSPKEKICKRLDK
jgi:hypothetical protein